MSDQEASTLGSLMQRLSAAAKDEAGAECVYVMGFGEQNRHFHFMLLTRSEAMMAADLKGAGLIENAPKLANRDEAIRVGSRIRERLAASLTLAMQERQKHLVNHLRNVLFRWIASLEQRVFHDQCVKYLKDERCQVLGRYLAAPGRVVQ
jgi:hypothetical protein